MSLLWGIEKVWIKRWGEYQQFPSKIFCPTVPKIAVGEPFSLSLISGIETVWMRKWGGGVYQDFPSKIFCPKVPKKVVGQPFRVSLISGIEKFHTSEGYVTIFCRYFLSHSTEKFRWENPSLLCFRKFPVAIKLMDKKKGRVSRISVESFLSDLAKNS